MLVQCVNSSSDLVLYRAIFMSRTTCDRVSAITAHIADGTCCADLNADCVGRV